MATKRPKKPSIRELAAAQATLAAQAEAGERVTPVLQDQKPTDQQLHSLLEYQALSRRITALEKWWVNHQHELDSDEWNARYTILEAAWAERLERYREFATAGILDALYTD